MSKTSEEEIRTYAQMCSVDEAGYVVVEKAIQFGIDLHKSLPLSQRLTDEERERVRKMYDNAMEVFCDTRDIEAKEYAMCRLNTLEEIFGKELFGEGEG